MMGNLFNRILNRGERALVASIKERDMRRVLEARAERYMELREREVAALEAYTKVVTDEMVEAAIVVYLQYHKTTTASSDRIFVRQMLEAALGVRK